MPRANLKTYAPGFREEAVNLVMGQGLSLANAGQRVPVPKGRWPTGVRTLLPTR
jgi:hypothetical protein